MSSRTSLKGADAGPIGYSSKPAFCKRQVPHLRFAACGMTPV